MNIDLSKELNVRILFHCCILYNNYYRKVTLTVLFSYSFVDIDL